MFWVVKTFHNITIDRLDLKSSTFHLMSEEMVLDCIMTASGRDLRAVCHGQRTTYPSIHPYCTVCQPIHLLVQGASATDNKYSKTYYAGLYPSHAPMEYLFYRRNEKFRRFRCSEEQENK